MNTDANFFVDDTRLELRDCASAHIYNSLSSLNIHIVKMKWECSGRLNLRGVCS